MDGKAAVAASDEHESLLSKKKREKRHKEKNAKRLLSSGSNGDLQKDDGIPDSIEEGMCSTREVRKRIKHGIGKLQLEVSERFEKLSRNEERRFQELKAEMVEMVELGRNKEKEIRELKAEIRKHQSNEEEMNDRLKKLEESDEEKKIEKGKINMSLPEDTYSLILVSGRLQHSWSLGLFIFFVQLLLMVFLGIEMFSNYAHLHLIPKEIPGPPILISQFLVFCAVFFLQGQLAEACTMLFLVYIDASKVDELVKNEDENEDKIISKDERTPNDERELVKNKEDDRLDKALKERVRLLVFLWVIKAIMAIMTIGVAFVLIVGAKDILNLLKDFAALMIITELDDVAFAFIDATRMFGVEAAKKVKQIKNREVTIEISENRRRWDLYFVGSVYTVVFLVWFLVLGMQENGTIAKVQILGKWKTCKLNDDKDYKKIQNGICDGGIYASKQCKFDGGDCTKCKDTVKNFSKIGDGICDYGAYMSKDCGSDGGDCKDFLSKCKVEFPEQIGDGKCDLRYNTTDCLFDLDDCKKFDNQTKNCEVENQDWLGDGICDGEEYNTPQCWYDGGDCINTCEFSKIGDGNCDGDAYLTLECLFDHGDCCNPEDWSKIGDGNCDGDEYNTTECAYDGGDCVNLYY
mmetsp:Transcript_25491/g.38660  ORF Transcript_25491/g.38660 Transcript_25491/m.38660 type:complete len:634 (-) Transcript_25491:82-1983(-)|eukprot:CAMPEP_0178911520 /NCGR_PEP_ID=MMETSP0786-20121207/9745_1 /TAXON_ID=186022 /ORGANISM="Thalassionema frauenfeldii, Strain CCMP 1798" /LENGTH=633 /DNA_ID=CAMNT_0020583985 /DNA_START=223 /DNA_END=2124 /DNA_ORIENTATION=-